MELAIINKVVVGEKEVHGSVEVKTRCGQGRIVTLQLALCNRHGLIHQDTREKSQDIITYKLLSWQYFQALDFPNKVNTIYNVVYGSRRSS